MSDLYLDEWHTYETIVKIVGTKHYIRFIISSETSFVIGFHLSTHRDYPKDIFLLSVTIQLGKPSTVVSNRYSAYKITVKSIFDDAKHICVKSLKDAISNNLMNTYFNRQFKAWHKTKQGFYSFKNANSLISGLFSSLALSVPILPQIQLLFQ